MAQLVLDHLDTLEMDEQNGVVRSLTRKARITGLNPANVDYNVLIEAYNQVGLPTPGAFLQGSAMFPLPNPTITQYALSMLVLAKRRFKLLDDKTSVDVFLEYQHFMDGDNQNLTNQALSPNGWKVPNSPVVYGKNRASVQQTKANFVNSLVQAQSFDPFGNYPIGSVVDYQGFFWIAIQDQIWAGPPNAQLPFPPGPAGTAVGVIWGILSEQQIIASLLFPPIIPLLGVVLLPAPGVRRQVLVGHQFPSTDLNAPGQTKFQTGEFTIMQPNDNFKLHGQVFIRNPRVIKKAILRAINSVPWMDGNAYEWMCMEVSWEPLFVEFQWRMSFEFQHNEDTWLPTAIFNDARTGRPPSGLVQGFGVRQLHFHPEVDFERYFRLTFGCAPEAGA